MFCNLRLVFSAELSKKKQVRSRWVRRCLGVNVQDRTFAESNRCNCNYVFIQITFATQHAARRRRSQNHNQVFFTY